MRIWFQLPPCGSLRTHTHCQCAHTRFVRKRCRITQSDAGEPSWWTVGRGGDSGGSVLGCGPVPELELREIARARATSGTKRPVWVYYWCLQLCCFFTLLAKSCPNTHSSLTSSTRRENGGSVRGGGGVGGGYAIFFHCKSRPLLEEGSKAASWQGCWGDRRVAAEWRSGAQRGDSCLCASILTALQADMEYEFSWGQCRRGGVALWAVRAARFVNCLFTIMWKGIWFYIPAASERIPSVVVWNQA